MPLSAYDLNIRHLRALLAIEQYNSVSAAARAVSLSQPALTQGLAKLERQLGCQLFERHSGDLTATEGGEIVLERVRAGFGHLARGTRRLARGFSQPDKLMTMTQLRALLSVADAGSFTAGTALNNRSRTALYRAVVDLERIVGGKVVERRGHGTSLNAAGRLLARGARLMIAEITAAIADLGIDEGPATITVGALPTARAYIIPAAVGRLAREHPRVRFEIAEGNWRELADPLRDGVIDVMVGALRPYEIDDLVQMPLIEDRLIIVTGSQHPFAGASMPSIGELAAYPWIVGPANSPLREKWEQLFSGHRLPPAPIECGSVMIVGRLLTEGDYLTLLSPDQIGLQMRSGLLAMVGTPLPNSTRMIGYTIRRNWRPTIVQRRFLQLLEEITKDGPLVDWSRMNEWRDLANQPVSLA